MTVRILKDKQVGASSRFLAVAGGVQSEGETAGAALDALTKQLGDAAGDPMLVVVARPFHPDSFFTEAEQAELEGLMNAWRSARDHNGTLNPADEARLEQLVTAELTAAARRSATLAQGARP
jgi:hypothetical protein